MLKIAICDDSKEIIEEIYIILNKTKIKLNTDIELESFSSGEELIKSIDKGKYFDLIFLDIEMYKLSGIDVARYIREHKHNYNTQIAFITGKNEYVKAVFEVNTLNFIEKPIKSDEIIKTINQLIKMQESDKRFFTWKSEGEYHSIPYLDIHYFEINKRTITIYTKNRKIEIIGSLRKIEEKLDMCKFIKVHQSFIVNKSKIEKLGNCTIKLYGLNVEIPVARDRRSQIISIIFE